MDQTSQRKGQISLESMGKAEPLSLSIADHGFWLDLFSPDTATAVHHCSFHFRWILIMINERQTHKKRIDLSIAMKLVTAKTCAVRSVHITLKDTNKDK